MDQIFQSKPTSFTQADVDRARAEGATAERERLNSILSSDAAKGKSKAALSIAMAGVTLGQAETILAGVPTDAPPAVNIPGRSKDAPGGLAQVEPASFAQSTSALPDTSTAWKKSVDRVNAGVEARMNAGHA